MGLLQIEIAGSKIERKPCYLYFFFHTMKVKYETVFTPKFAGSVTDPAHNIVWLLFPYYPSYCWGFFSVQKEDSHA